MTPAGSIGALFTWKELVVFGVALNGIFGALAVRGTAGNESTLWK